jgi:hypothetical protein
VSVGSGRRFRSVHRRRSRRGLPSSASSWVPSSRGKPGPSSSGDGTRRAG